MDWFEKLTGFKEGPYKDAKSKLRFEGSTMTSMANSKQYDLGTFEVVSLETLRQRVKELPLDQIASDGNDRLTIDELQADAYALHTAPSTHGAVVQVASQFNLLEMPGPNTTPEHGVTGYHFDKTQGPACAMAAGPATLFRNYGVDVDGALNGEKGQTAQRQINTFDELAKALGLHGVNMKNGYAMIAKQSLIEVNSKIAACTEPEREHLKGLLKVGVHWHTQVTADGAPESQRVTQVLCSAIPIAYNAVTSIKLWEPLARLVLDACYEATFCIGLLNAEKTGNPNLYLTRVGGGAFGNKLEWIDESIARACLGMKCYQLKVYKVKRAIGTQSLS